MDLLSAATACALLVTAPASCDRSMPMRPVTASRVAQWDGFITEAARRFAIPDAWIRGVMAQESAGFTAWNGQPITSAKGAMGLMQLMPGTWADMRSRLGLGTDPYDPHDNILAGAAYLHDLAERFGSGAFAAYNAGPGRYMAYLEGRKALPSETESYLAKLTPGVALPLKSTPSDGLFFVNSASLTSLSVASRAALPAPDPAARAHDLFVPLSSPSR